MRLWKIEFPNKEHNDLVYIDRNHDNNHRIRIKMYRSLWPDDMFTRPEMTITLLKQQQELTLMVSSILYALENNKDYIHIWT